MYVLWVFYFFVFSFWNFKCWRKNLKCWLEEVKYLLMFDFFEEKFVMFLYIFFVDVFWEGENLDLEEDELVVLVIMEIFSSDDEDNLDGEDDFN